MTWNVLHLVWKNCMICKNHILWTLFQTMFPGICCFLLLKKEKTFFWEDPFYPLKINEHSIYSTYYSRYVPDGYELLFAPKTSVSSKLMEQVQQKLHVEADEFKSFSSKKEMKSYIKNMTDRESKILYRGVYFEDTDNLKYTILNADVPPAKAFSDTKIFHYIAGRGTYIYEELGYLAIQMAVDKAFIQHKTGGSAPNIEMQEFPYPAHTHDPNKLNTFRLYLPLAVAIGIFVQFIIVVGDIAEEKHTGFWELMKIMGFKSWELWLGWFFNYLIINVLTIAVLVIILKVPLMGNNSPVINHSSAGVLFLYLLSYYCTIVTFGFCISTFFKSPRAAMIVGFMVWMILSKIYRRLIPSNPGFWSVLLLGLLAPDHVGRFGLEELARFEVKESDVGVTSMFTPAYSTSSLSMGSIVVILLLQGTLYLLLTLYIDAIYPGAHGVPKNPTFPLACLRKMYLKYRGIHVVDEEEEYHQEEAVESATRVEPVSNLQAGISIKRLNKHFGTFKAVDNLSIDIYQGQITALLGHNGAGKTTTLSVITGMIKPTSGAVIINGMNIKNHMQEIRKNFGFCPQHDLLCRSLSVEEHLIFFSMLKGLSYKDSKDQAVRIMELLGLLKSKGFTPDSLSGGMKRKLCLGMAFVGGTNYLILDEPTSGLDPESRRSLWDTILSFRGNRTIIITTHNMEEADVLGDRVAIMQTGKLICYGTAMFLKSVYGSGYHLTIVRNEDALSDDKFKAIASLVTQKVSKATLTSAKGKSVVFLLPYDAKSSFAGLLQALESQKEALGINYIGLSITSLEEVFLNVEEMNRQAQEEDNIEEVDSFIEARPRYKGCRLVVIQFWTLLKKRFFFFKRKYLFQLAAISLCFFIAYVHVGGREDFNIFANSTIMPTLGMYAGSVVLLSRETSDGKFDKLEKFYTHLVNSHGCTVKKVTNISETLLDTAKNDFGAFLTERVIALEFSPPSVTAMYSNPAVHGAPVSLNLLTSAIVEHPISTSYETAGELEIDNDEMNDILDVMSWQFYFPLGITVVLSTFLILPVLERTSGIKSLQTMCVNPLVYWLSFFLVDFVILLVAIACIIVAFCLFAEKRYTGPEELRTIFNALLAFGVGMTPVTYLLSYSKTMGRAVLLYFIIMLVTLWILPLPTAIYVQDDPLYLCLVNLFLPSTGVQIFMLQFVTVIQSSNPRVRDMTGLESLQENPLLNIAASSLFYFAVLILMELHIMRKLWECVHLVLIKLCGTSSKPHRKSPEIVAEENRVATEWKKERSTNPDILLVRNLGKRYRSVVPVTGVSFGIKPGECFGLLGVTGAGKTTIFNMLAGNIAPSSGNARILLDSGRQIYLSWRAGAFTQNIGYCPQHHALIESLTGKELLTVFANLRGVKHVAKEVKSWIHVLGLQKYQNRECGQYSGGNKRKLSTAMALIGNLPFVMLDEPTTGVDPSSRRKLWSALTTIQERKLNQTFLLSSHSMDESEVLSTRLTIMKAGQFECLGTIPEIKKKYGQGLTVVLKLSQSIYRPFWANALSESGSAPADPPAVAELMKFFQNKYGTNCVLKDKHCGLLHYHIHDTDLTLSRVFQEVDALQSKFPIVEDYNVRETSLEEVFLAIARQK